MAIVFISVLIYCAFCVTIIGINKYKYRDFMLDDTHTGVIIGDSHMVRSVIGDSLSGIVNLSNSAEGYFFSFAKLRYLIEHGCQIERVYLGFNYNNLSTHYEEFICGNQSDQIIGRYHAVLKFHDYMDLIKMNPGKTLCWLNAVVRDGLNGLIVRGEENDCLGKFKGDKLVGVLNRDYIDTRINEQFYNDTSVYATSRQNMDDFNRIIELCQSENIEVILVRSPLHKLYLQNVPERFQRAYDSILASRELLFYDLSLVDIPDTNFFIDGDHVNYNGAILSTEYFNLLNERYFDNR